MGHRIGAPFVVRIAGRGERLRLAILDVAGSGTVAVDVDAHDGSLMDGLLRAAALVVASMKSGLP
jgi:hypothetical protein